MPVNDSYSQKELIAAFIEKRVSENLKAFSDTLPEVYEKFAHYQEERFYVIYDDHGGLNLFDRKNESLVYGPNPVQQCLDNFESYIQAPVQRPFFIVPNSQTNEDQVNYVHSNALGSVGKEQMLVLENVAREVRNALVEKSDINIISGDHKKNSEEINVGPLPDFVNTLFLFSTGMGFDVEKLYLERNIKHLIIIEPDLDVFYASLQLIDWSSILSKSIEKKFDISFIIGSDFQNSIAEVSAVVGKIGRHNVAGAYFYSSFYIEEYKELFKMLKSSVSYSFLSGFGFYDDSRYSLAHTIGNIKKKVPILSSNKKIVKSHGQESIPVFVIGNGPSLDESIGFLKASNNSAVIVSCGSALPALISNGIQPDFHVELERTATVTHWIKKSGDIVDGFFDKIKKIKLIIASQVHPEVVDLFGDSGLLLKDIETGSSFAHQLFKSNGVALIPRLAPTCVHTAFTSMVLLGFKKIYFFGTDMGSLDLNKHHSKHSNYSHLKKEIEKDFIFKKGAEVYKSNFGDKEVYSSGLYPMFKRELESIIGGWKYTFLNNFDVYNCSDGAMLDGAEPCQYYDLDLPEINEKDQIIDKVFSSYFSFYPEYSSKGSELLLDAISQVEFASDYAKSIIRPVDSREQAFKLLDRFVTEFHSDLVLADSYAWLYSVFDGSLLYMLSVMSSTLMLPVNEDVVVKAFNNQAVLLSGLFDSIKRDFRDHSLDWDQESRYSDFSG